MFMCIETFLMVGKFQQAPSLWKQTVSLETSLRQEWVKLPKPGVE